MGLPAYRPDFGIVSCASGFSASIMELGNPDLLVVLI